MEDIYFVLIVVGCTGFLSWSIAHSISSLKSALNDQTNRILDKLNEVIRLLGNK